MSPLPSSVWKCMFLSSEKFLMYRLPVLLSIKLCVPLWYICKSPSVRSPSSNFTLSPSIRSPVNVPPAFGNAALAVVVVEVSTASLAAISIPSTVPVTVILPAKDAPPWTCNGVVNCLLI